MEPIQYEKRGYLREDFRLFHLADNEHETIAYHYHSFHKIVILLAGRAGYAIEGEQFQLQPGDYILVGRGCVHRPIVESGDFYERMVLYIDPEFLNGLSAEADLETCFLEAEQNHRYVFHASDRIRDIFAQMEKTKLDDGFGSNLLLKSIFIQLIVEINRNYMDGEQVKAQFKDQKIIAILQYINEHLADNLSIDELSEDFYISKYHMMRRFKEETGYGIHQYIQDKRLLMAQELMKKGKTLGEIAESCGYQDYSTFSRAYKKHYGSSPKTFLN